MALAHVLANLNGLADSGALEMTAHSATSVLGTRTLIGVNFITEAPGALEAFTLAVTEMGEVAEKPKVARPIGDMIQEAQDHRKRASVTGVVKTPKAAKLGGKKSK